LREASARLGARPEELVKALETNDAQALKNRLSPENAARLNALLADETAMQALLARPELKELLRGLEGTGGTYG